MRENTSMTRTGRAAVAGAASATLWIGVEPLLKRVFGTPYSDSQFASAFVTRGRLQPLVSLAIHSSVGALFGGAWSRVGGRGPLSGMVAAELENAALWPSMLLFDRIHPNVRDGTWPPLLRNRRAFAAAAVGHAFFGATLGLLAGDGD
jgi:hypothetical protein